MSKKIVAGNWKMNLNYLEASSLFNSLNKQPKNENVTVIVSPAAIYLSEFSKSAKNISLAAQNVSGFSSGAYTGEVSAQMLKHLDIPYCLVGHSERRTYFNETDDVVNQKVKLLLEHGISPIFCCGESLDQRNQQKQNDVISSQIDLGLADLSKDELLHCVIAYEPVWAIGTGLTASSDQAQQMHAFIRNKIADKYDLKTADSVSILYGGSCNANNAAELFSKKDVNGGLIGGAALKSASFNAIISSIE